MGYLILHLLFSIGTHHRLQRMQVQKCVVREGPLSRPSLNVYVPCTTSVMWLLNSRYLKHLVFHYMRFTCQIDCQVLFCNPNLCFIVKYSNLSKWVSFGLFVSPWLFSFGFFFFWLMFCLNLESLLNILMKFLSTFYSSLHSMN